MPVPVNAFKQAIRQGQAQIGFWQGLVSPYAAEISAGSGFDWLLIDGEHAPNDMPSLLAQLQAVAPYPVHPVARPPVGQTHVIKQYLDIGFTTLLIPMVESGSQAAELVRAVRYPPAGVRGVATGLARAARWNRIPDYLEQADAQICLLVQVESRKGLDAVEAIAATDGVDGVFIGPSDLSAALGHRGNPGHPEVQAAIERIIAAVREAEKAVGILAVEEAAARRYLELGCSFVAVGTDIATLARGASSLAARFKADGSTMPAAGAAY